MPRGIYKHIPTPEVLKHLKHIGFQKGNKLNVGKKNPMYGKPSWNKGLKFPTLSGKNHFAWKGDSVSYASLHKWVKRELGRPTRCSNVNCKYPRRNALGKLMKQPQRYEWANIDHKYRRKLSDYISLCASCHRKMDIDFGKIIAHTKDAGGKTSRLTSLYLAVTKMK